MRRLVGEFVGSASGIADGIRIVVLRARTQRRTRIAVRILSAGLCAGVLAVEVHTSWFESKVFSAAARRLTFSLQPGSNQNIRYPHSGPYDRRLGYAELPAFLDRLKKSGLQVTAQARTSRFSNILAGLTGFMIYPEKGSAGLQLLDYKGRTLFRRLYPERTYADFETIPPVIVRSLLFIENRELLDPGTGRRNPVLEWDRLAKAVGDATIHWFRQSQPVAGGSTLATQIEKVRHSPEGRTSSAVEKARQMAAASIRAYMDGEETMSARRRIVRDYLNSLPLASRSGHGEVCGLGDGLWVWFGADFNEVNRLLWLIDAEPAAAPLLSEQAKAYRQVLSLVLATKKPSVYLNGDRSRLSARVDSYLRLSAASGVIPGRLRDVALSTHTVIRSDLPNAPVVDFVERKGGDSIRVELMSQLGLTRLYDLDRLDMTVRTTLDSTVGTETTKVLTGLSDPAYATAAGVTGERLLNPDGLESVIYGFTLYERTPAGNALRVQVDSFDGPFSMNQGAKLELGSTAKLRTLVTYLEAVAELHNRYTMGGQRGEAGGLNPQDRLSRWAEEYLASVTDKGLPAMLEVAMNRRYSANPGERFFTGGGAHQFANFDAKDNVRLLTVREAFQRSVNLVFIRLMRDLVNYYMGRSPGSSPRILDDESDPMRLRYLSRFADEEGRKFLHRFYTRNAGSTPDSALATLIQRGRPTAQRLSVIHRSVRPEAGLNEFTAFLGSHPTGQGLSVGKVQELYRTYGPGQYGLNDRAYLAHVHPLELWLLEYLHKHPRAQFREVEAASVRERQEVYQWLLRSERKHAQDFRIRTLLEADAFQEIHRQWQRLGYPFPSLVPSLASAIGSSGDTPAALSELVGIILNGGVRHPVTRIQQIRFAEATPFETILTPRPQSGAVVLSTVIADKVRNELVGVVQTGTGRRAFGSVLLSDGRTLPVGGKTGTGDNRLHVYGSRGVLMGSSPINRTAAFVFFIGDRFFGTVVAYVPGAQAGHYSFTSALPLQVFRQLVPTLRPLLDQDVGAPIRHETQYPQARVLRLSRSILGASFQENHPEQQGGEEHDRHSVRTEIKENVLCAREEPALVPFQLPSKVGEHGGTPRMTIAPIKGHIEYAPGGKWISVILPRDREQIPTPPLARIIPTARPASISIRPCT
jgi:membrane peptidoglycan carboxypeptidase